MLPVTVERKWGGNWGALSWWLPVKMDEVQRHFGGEADRGHLRLLNDLGLEPVVVTDNPKL